MMTLTATSILSIASIAAAANHQHHQSNMQDKQFNIEWNILPTTIGYLSGSVNYKLTQDSAVGIFGGTQFNSNDKKMYDIGLTYIYAFNGNYMSSGWLAKPFMAYGHQEYKSNPTKSSKSGIAIGTTFSYKWMTDGGFNIQLGIGPYFSTVNYAGIDSKDGHQGIGLVGELSIGLAL
jgi:hypothetical protein